MRFNPARREWLFALASCTLLAQRPDAADSPKDWVCPMDPDVRSNQAGTCPRCGMKLVLQVPERVEYPLELSQSPESLRAGGTATLTFRVLNPQTNEPVRRFEIVHEKLMHVFLVNENLEFFAHLHPAQHPDGSFTLNVELPFGGMYRILADFYPSGAVPQLAVDTLYVQGEAQSPKLQPSLAPSKAANLTAALRMEPEQPLAGLETRLFFALDPAEGLELYLGAWGHMLAVSGDLIDMLHIHPFLVSRGEIQFNIVFPRPGLYRIWTQFQRKGEVNTVVFTVPVTAL